MKHSFKNLLMIILTMVSLIINAVGVTPAHAAENWELVGGIAGFSAGTADYTSLAVYNGTPYVAYRDGANGNKATVMKFDGTNWVLVGPAAGFSAGQAEYTALALDSSGVPYVAYRDADNGGKATVMKFNGTSWVLVGTAVSAGQADYTSLALDSSGMPYVAYRDGANSGKATVMKFNGTSWVLVGPAAGFSAGQADYTSLALDSSGMPYVAYRDGSYNNGWATVMKFNGTSWAVVGTAGFSAGIADYTSLALDSSGMPYVAYKDWGQSFHATVMKFDGANWVLVGQRGFSAGEAKYTSLAVDNGTPYVAYQDLGTTGSRATVMKFNGTSWGVVVAAGISAGQANYTSLGVKNSLPYVAYRDGSTTPVSGKATVLRYTGDAPLRTVTFNANGGSNPNDGSTTSQQSAYTPTALTQNTFTRPGYTFIGWNTASNGSGIVYANGAQYHFVADITLYAQWNLIPPHTVTFRPNGGTGFMIKQKTNMPTPLTPNAFTRPGYEFKGWNTAANGSGTLYGDQVVYDFSANIILYAQWEAILNALDFDGVDDYVSIDSMPALDDFTLEYWLYPRSPDGSLGFITYTQGDIFNTANDDSGNIWVYEPGLDWVQVTNATPNDWTHLAFVRSGTTLTVYKNGAEVYNNSVSATPLSSGWCFGRKCDSGEFGNMILDEVRIWKVARTESEILDNMNSEVSPHDDLVAYYKFNQGKTGGDNTNPAVNTAIDRSGSGLNGTLNNFTLNGATSNWVAGMALTAAPGIAAPTINQPPDPTNNPTPTVTGTATPGNWVEVWYHDSSMIDPPNHWEKVCDLLVVSGTWSCDWTVDDIAEGQFWLGAVAHVGTEYGESSATVDSVLDLTPPTVTIDPQTLPDDHSNSRVADFGFFANDNLSSAFSFFCALDEGDWVDCSDDPITSGGTKSYSGLSGGTHIFKVDAVDEAGNSRYSLDPNDPNIASYTWTIDLPAGELVVQAPNGSINDNTPAISGTAEAGSWVNVWYFDNSDDPVQICQDVLVDGNGDWSCDSSAVLPDREIVLAVNAMDGGGESDDVSHTFTVDTIASETQIDSHPNNPTLIVDATFTFSSPDPTATFECQLDGGGFSTCTSPKNYTLPNGPHIFEVRATDAAGNVDDFPASYAWMIGTVPVVGAGTYDDGHVGWTYTGNWIAYNGSGPANNTMHYTNVQGASASITFSGIGFTLYFAQHVNRGNVEVWIDGAPRYTINQYGSLVWQQSWTLPAPLSNGTHTVQFKNPNASAATYIDIDAIAITAPVNVGMYDDGHAAWIYTGNWTAYSGSGPANNTMHYTNVQGASASIAFSGTRFTVYFARHVNRGNVEVWIDGVNKYTINQNGSPLAWQQSWTLPAPLSNGTHTVQFKNPNASAAMYIDIDAIQVLGPLQPVGVGTYDDEHAAWIYNGNWTAYNGNGPANNTMHYTNVQNASASITFSGTGFTVYFAQSVNRGNVEVWIDGVQRYTINQNGSPLVWQQSWTLPAPLSNGPHTVQFKNPNASTATYTDIDAIAITVPVGGGTYDDAHTAWRYTGNWTAYSGGGGPANNTMHYTNVQGATASITFSGIQFTVYFAQSLNRGSVEVWIDGVQRYTINQNGSLIWQQSWTLPAPLSAGKHTVQFRNPNVSTATYTDIDAITILGPLQPVGVGTYDDAHTAWMYTGDWTAYNGSGPANNTMHYTSTQNASASITFTGTRFTVYFAKNVNRGSVEVWIDGVQRYTINQNGSLAWQQSWTLPAPLRDEIHTVQFKNPNPSTSTYIDIDAIAILDPLQPVGVGTYDDAHAAWIYTGNWTAYNGSGPASNTMHYTSTQNASAGITFTGTSFTVYFAQSVNRGSVEVWIDGVNKYTINQNGSLVWQQSWTLPAPLSNGQHAVEFRNPNASAATYIDIDAIVITAPVTAGTYDDADAAWMYTNNWTAYNGSGPANNTMHYTNVQGATASITFTGTQFTVYFAQSVNRGSVEVWIDGIKQYTINQNGSLAWQSSWILPAPLSNGTHTVQFKNPNASAATYIDIDTIQIQ